jgi:hypothetical protein
VGDHSERFLLRTYLRKNYRDEGLYSGEEADITEKEHLESARTGEVQIKELHRGEP